MEKKNSRRPVVFDLTRMFMYIGRLFPSGIERVDINYLHGIISDARFSVLGMLELSKDKNSYFIGIDKNLTNRIHKHLYDRWILGETDDEKFTEQAGLLKSEILRQVGSAKLDAFSHVDKSLLRLKASGVRPLYVNCSFINIPHGERHRDLMIHAGFSPVYVVHDLIPIEFPEYSYSKDGGAGHLSRLLAAGQLNATIVAISEHVKCKILEVAGVLGLDGLRILVNHNGVDSHFIKSSQEIPRDRKNQFVFVSTIEPRKNHLLLLNVWRKIINGGMCHEEIPKLHLIGRRGWGYQAVGDMLDHNPSIKQHIFEYNTAPDSLLVNLIQESRAMLFPSFDEGWGLPIVESMALGTPVICSDLPVHRECTQGNGIFIDPIDGMSWYRTIINVSRGDLIPNCGDFMPVRWSHAAERFNEIIAAVA